MELSPNIFYSLLLYLQSQYYKGLLDYIEYFSVMK